MKAILHFLFTLAFLLGSSTRANAGGLTPEQRTQVREAFVKLATHPSKDWVFLVVADARTQQFVQFGRPDKSVAFDFPIHASRRPGAPSPLKDGACTSTAPAAASGEQIERHRSIEEEERIAAVLRALRIPPAKRYCEMLDKEGRRHGHTLSIAGSIRNVDQGVQLVDEIFARAYLLQGIEALEIEIGQ